MPHIDPVTLNIYYICRCGGDDCYPHHFVTPYTGGRELVVKRMKRGWRYRPAIVGPQEFSRNGKRHVVFAEGP